MLSNTRLEEGCADFTIPTDSVALPQIEMVKRRGEAGNAHATLHSNITG
jgi:hypothetical protein